MFGFGLGLGGASQGQNKSHKDPFSFVISFVSRNTLPLLSMMMMRRRLVKRQIIVFIFNNTRTVNFGCETENRHKCELIYIYNLSSIYLYICCGRDVDYVLIFRKLKKKNESQWSPNRTNTTRTIRVRHSTFTINMSTTILDTNINVFEEEERWLEAFRRGRGTSFRLPQRKSQIFFLKSICTHRLPVRSIPWSRCLWIR